MEVFLAGHLEASRYFGVVIWAGRIADLPNPSLFEQLFDGQDWQVDEQFVFSQDANGTLTDV
jgi:hypothetical protein